MTIREQIDRILAARKEKGKELEARLEAWKKLKESLYRGTSSLVMESMDIKDDKLREQYGRIFNDVDASEVELLKLMDQVVTAMGRDAEGQRARHYNLPPALGAPGHSQAVHNGNRPGIPE